MACLLKTFLSSLPTRLVPEYACNIFWHILNMPEDCFLKSVLLTVFLLPTMHIQCLQALLSFLAKVNANEKHNKMSLDSLAIILAPSLFQKQNGKKITQNEIQNGISVSCAVLCVCIEFRNIVSTCSCSDSLFTTGLFIMLFILSS